VPAKHRRSFDFLLRLIPFLPETPHHVPQRDFLDDGPAHKQGDLREPCLRNHHGSLLSVPDRGTLSYEQVIHPDDRPHVLKKLARAVQSGNFDERFRIVKPDGEVRWVWVHRFPREDPNGNMIRLGGTALDITGQKTAEDQVAANLAKANSAWAEAEALSKATLALTEDLHMDSVLDALLRSLADLVPYTCARVLVPEGGPHWLALGEKSCPEPAQKLPRNPLT
jgi:hypothetical protein